MTAYMNYSQQPKDEDDDMSLADIISLKISTAPLEEKNTMVDNTMWNDWTVQNELYHQQLQSSYYQLQYLQQQQMMMMMNSNHSRRSSTISSSNTSTTSSINSSRYHHHRPHLSQYHQLSPSSSSSSIKQYRPESKRNAAANSNSGNSPTARKNRTSIPAAAVAAATIVPTTEPPKRRQSLGKRIKKVFGMTETSTRSSLLPAELPNHPLRVDTTTSTSTTASTKITNPADKKKARSSVTTLNSPVVMTMPNSPNSSISSRQHHRHSSRRYPDNQLPSPASSTVSTTSTNTTTTTSTNTTNKHKKTLSFNSVIKLHETFSASEYDRRCDTSATCQKLTPVLALKIKEELNNFKLNDMFVHVDSRQNTHFFM